MNPLRDFNDCRTSVSQLSSGGGWKWELGSGIRRRITARTAPTSVFNMHERPSSLPFSLAMFYVFPFVFSCFLIWVCYYLFLHCSASEIFGGKLFPKIVRNGQNVSWVAMFWVLVNDHFGDLGFE